MPAPPHGETLLIPKHPTRRAQEPDARAAGGAPAFVHKGRRTSFISRATTALPPNLLNQAAARLRTLALLYAFTFFMAAFFPALLFSAERAHMAEHPLHWAPGVISIADALLVAFLLPRVRLQPGVVVVLAMMFEVVSSYGIAAAEFLQPMGLDVAPPWIGMSWVGVWTLLFNVVVPMVPRHAVVSALASVTSVPAMVLLSLSAFPPPPGAWVPPGVTIFFTFFFPYLLVVVMAYVGARVVYALGTEVSRATELGSYRLVERLGVGGMGEVWRADHRLLVRPAAIKLIRSSPGDAPGLASEDMQRRFEREAQAIANLRSPHTVTLFDFGIADDGAFYYAMELLDGLDADSLVKRFGPMPAERVVFVLRQICHSLSEAESCGLVHRDIKPANIFLCRYGEDHDFVKVLDFGIAKATQDTTQTQTSLTIANVIQGTPAFIAPEQVLGGMELDGRADIYSTGCVAYWLLTGELVFSADTPMKLLLAHAHSVPDAPSARTELPVPSSLDALVLDCLAKDRDQRPRSARDLLARLDAVTLERPWTDERARQWWKTHLPAQ